MIPMSLLRIKKQIDKWKPWKKNECEHPLNEIILERNYYGLNEDSDYTNYFRCDKCGEEIETDGE